MVADVQTKERHERYHQDGRERSPVAVGSTVLDRPVGAEAVFDEVTDRGRALRRRELLAGRPGVVVDFLTDGEGHPVGLVPHSLWADGQLAVQHGVGHQDVMRVVGLVELKPETAGDYEVDEAAAEGQ